MGLLVRCTAAMLSLSLLSVPAQAAPPLVSDLPGAEPKAMLDAIEEASRVTDSPDTLVDQFLFAFVHLNGPQVLMYMDEPLRRRWLGYMHPTWRFWGSQPWFEDAHTTRRSEVEPGGYEYEVTVGYGGIGEEGKRVHGTFPLSLRVSRSPGGWYLVDEVHGYPPFSAGLPE